MKNGLRGRLAALVWTSPAIHYIDQRALPDALRFAAATTLDEVIDAVLAGAVEGARYIDLFGAFGVAFARLASNAHDAGTLAAGRVRAAAGPFLHVAPACDRVAAASRETALSEAQRCLRESQHVDRAIAGHAAGLFASGDRVLTHGSSGAFATGGCGTAVGAIVSAVLAGNPLNIFVTEGRPRNTGARLTMFELAQAGIAATLCVDAAVAPVLRNATIDVAIIGARAIAMNGDIVGEIGTYALALAAAQHGVPVYVAAARAAIDARSARGDDLPCAADRELDVTPARLIAGIVSEYGVTRPPYHEAVQTLLSRPNFALIAVAQTNPQP